MGTRKPPGQLCDERNAETNHDDTVEYKINLITPAIGDKLEAVGTVLKSGRTLSISRLDVYAHSGGQRKLVAAGQQTLIRGDALSP